LFFLFFRWIAHVCSAASSASRAGARNGSGLRSEEEKMTSIALSAKAAKLMKLCDAAGFNSLADLLAASITDSVCPAICMTEGCDYTTEMEPDQTEGYCEACGGNTVVSALVLAGII
jgi:hypothetical protein